MAEHELIRQRLKDLLGRKGLNVLKLCQIYAATFPKDPKPLQHQAITKFLRGPSRGGSSAMRLSTRRKIEAVLGEYLLPEIDRTIDDEEQAKGGPSTVYEEFSKAASSQIHRIAQLDAYEIPLVYIWEIPLGISDNKIREQLAKVRRGFYYRAASDPPDPQLIWIRLNDKLGKRIGPNDEVLLSPESGKTSGDGSFVVVETKDEIVAGELRIIKGHSDIKIYSGRRFEEGSFRVLGKIIRFTGSPE